MMNLNHVRSFLTACEAGSIRAAARRLELAPSTIIDHLQQLEAALGGPLVERMARRTIPSSLGERFAPLARAMLATAGRALSLAAGQPLRIAAASNIGVYLLQERIAQFSRETGIAVETWIGANPACLARLEQGEADCAAVEWWDNRAGFEAHRWLMAELVAIAPPGHAWAGRASVGLDDLLSHPLLGGEAGTGTGRILRDALGPLADRISVLPGLGSTEAVKRAVRAGRGVSIVLRASVLDEIAAGHLLAMPLADAPLAKQLWLVAPAGLPSTAAARRCVAALTDGPPAASSPPCDPAPAGLPRLHG